VSYPLFFFKRSSLNLIWIVKTNIQKGSHTTFSQQDSQQFVIILNGGSDEPD